MKRVNTCHRIFGRSNILLLVISSFWFEGSHEEPTAAGWFQPISEVDLMEMNQITDNFPVSCPAQGSRLQ